MRATLVDAQLQERFARDGYVVIEGFLDQAEVAELAAGYQRLGPAPGDPQKYCHFDFQSPAPDYKTQVDALLRALFAPAMERHFDAYRPFYGNYIMKWPGPDSGFGVHQDMTFVDEETAVSASVWCPAIDTDEHNGALYFFPGSHLLVHGVRGSNQQAFPFVGASGLIEERYGVLVPLKAGDAIVFDHRVVHWSYANETEVPRLAAAVGVIPVEADLLHFHAIDADTLEGFRVPDYFFIDSDHFGQLQTEAEGVESIGRRPLVLQDISAQELAELMHDDVPIPDELLGGPPEPEAPRASATGGYGLAGPSIGQRAGATATTTTEARADTDGASAAPPAPSPSASRLPATHGPAGLGARVRRLLRRPGRP